MNTTTPYEYQKQVAQLLLVEKRNVILQAPTGAGKTRAALMPFLNALENNRDFPRRCIYSVPMRILAKQFVQEYEDAVKRAGRSSKIQVAIQTGEQPEDPYLASNLIFATIDQTLSSYLLAPYSLSRSRGNLNAGALLSSYLVFDEFHLFDPISTLPTTLHMLKMFKGITPFILMTATFSAEMLQELAHELDAVVVPGNDDERQQLDNLPSQQKSRFYHLMDDSQEPLNAKNVWACHQRHSLAICNTVDRAIALYDDLRRHAPADTEVILLHSRFLKEDRAKKEEDIRRLFGKRADKSGSRIVVSTQAIEVGVDMTCDMLHTELAPANAIIQRAGRCARYAGETGHIYIYRYAPDPEKPDNFIDLCENTAPYVSEMEKALFARTLEAFKDYQSSEKFTFQQEQAILSAVHGEIDQKLIRRIASNSYNYHQDIMSLLRGEKRTDYRHFIRLMNQQQVIIHANPDELLVLERPYEAPAFGLHAGTLQKYVKHWLEQYQKGAEALPWAVQYLHEDTDPAAEQANKILYRWVKVHSDPDEVWGAKLVCVHPKLATYDPQRGFLPNEGGTWQTSPPEQKEKQKFEGGTYRLETYAEHIRHVHEVFVEQWHEAEWAAQQLEKKFGWQPGSVRRAAELAVLLHDVGKLSEGWQGWVRDYQKKIAMEVDPEQAYAHTELRTPEHREIERSMKKRPWHAVEGALAAVGVLAETLENDDLLIAAFSAIARHHAPHSDSYQKFRLVKNAQRHITSVFKNSTELPSLASLATADNSEQIADFIATPSLNQDAAFLAYMLLVRALRRADSEGTRRGSQKTNL